MTVEVPESVVVAFKVVHSAVIAGVALLALKLWWAAFNDGFFRELKEQLPEKAQSVMVLTLSLGLVTAYLAVLVIFGTWT